MKIDKYEKKKNGMYTVYFLGGSNVDIHEELILKYGLLLHKGINDKELDKIIDENAVYIAYNLAIKYISIKMRTRKEIREHLQKKMFDNSCIDKVIKLLENAKYIDDEMYCKAYVNDRINLSNDGPNKIKDSLISSGMKEQVVIEALKVFDEDICIEKIKKIAEKQISVNRNKSKFILKNKIIEYLYNLGYSKSLIISVVDNLDFGDDSSIAKKEYQKIYNKLSKKYEGKELEYKVNQKMYSLGFKYEE